MKKYLVLVCTSFSVLCHTLGDQESTTRIAEHTPLLGPSMRLFLKTKIFPDGTQGGFSDIAFITNLGVVFCCDYPDLFYANASDFLYQDIHEGNLEVAKKFGLNTQLLAPEDFHDGEPKIVCKGSLIYLKPNALPNNHVVVDKEQDHA